MRWDAFEKLLTQAVEDAFATLEIERDRDPVYAICLSIAEDGMGMGLNANTESFFDRRRSEEEADGEMTSQEISYFRWSPGEWCFEGIGDDIFRQVNDLLGPMTLQDGIDDAAFENLIDAMTRALRRLRERHDRALQDVTLFVTLTDSAMAEEIENRSATRINPPHIAQGFLSRMD